MMGSPFPAFASIVHSALVDIIHRVSDRAFAIGLACAYGAVWLLAAITPLDRSDWLLENLLVFVFVPVLLVTYRRFAFSRASYLLIALFLSLHAMGAHYTYSKTPLGFWLQETLGLERNHYDRVVHFAYGLLLTGPVRELGLRAIGLRGVWSWVIPAMFALSLSAGYEIVEWWAARLVDPEVGIAFVGTQGDEWDAQKDMTLALSGAVLALLVSAGVGAARARARAR
jgi:putative membrane protein